MKHQQPALPFAESALEPYMSTETIQYHYGKHDTAYFKNLNTLIVGTPFESLPLEQIILEAEGKIFNNAAQAWNHTLFFEALSAHPKPLPEGSLMVAMEKRWATFDDFRKEFDAAVGALFGSGWVWLAADNDGHLSIISKQNAGNPLRDGLVPLLVCDVWEHAYYIDYRNRRSDFVTAFWKVVDWAVVERRFKHTHSVLVTP